jgi:hypothetical protein
MAETPSWFAAHASTGSNPFPEDENVAGNGGRVFANPERTCIVRLEHGPGAEFAVSADGSVALLLHGVVFDPAFGRTAADLLRQYDRQPALDWARELDGSFALIIIDLRLPALLVVTDRLSSRKVFATERDGLYRVASTLSLLPVDPRRLDRTGLAGFLLNGVFHNDRTAFADVRAVRRSTIERVGPDGRHTTTYWTHGFDVNPNPPTSDDLRAELAGLVVDAVRSRLPASGATYLSLSAGWDASTILGVLGRSLGVPGVRCVSYSLGPPRPDDDAVIGRAMAGLFGYDHRTLPSYSGSIRTLSWARATSTSAKRSSSGTTSARNWRRKPARSSPATTAWA